MDGRETDAVSGFWRSGKGGPDGVSTVSPLLSIVGLLESTPGSHPARGTSPTSGRAISGSGLGAPPDLSRGISALLTDSLSDQYVTAIVIPCQWIGTTTRLPVGPISLLVGHK